MLGRGWFGVDLGVRLISTADGHSVDRTSMWSLLGKVPLMDINHKPNPAERV